MVVKLGITFWFLLYTLAAQEPAFQDKFSLTRVNQPGAPAPPKGEISGAWVGTIEGKDRTQPVYLVLRQEGGTFTGTIGPNAGQQIPLRDVRVHDGTVQFALGRGPGVELTLKDDRLAGGTFAPGVARIRSAKDLEPAIARVDAMAAAEMAKENLASATIGIVSGSSLVWTKSYGLADIEGQLPAARDSVYRIGSITKQFTAVMLLQLVDLGKVRLSDPAEKYLPEIAGIPRFYPGTPPITLLQLATHTAGLIREPEDTPTFLKGPVAKWEEITLAAIAKLKYVYEPGTHYSYSNIGYALLGLALSRAAHQPYTEYVAEHILRPLGMSHTGFEPDPEMRRHLAKGYMISKQAADPAEAAAELETGRGYKVPNGALFTTVDDMARFVSMEMGDGPEAVLKRKVIADNLSRTSSADGSLSSGYGCGFSVERRGDFVIVGHGGAVAGYSANAFFHAPSHLGVVVLRNALGRAFSGDFVVRALQELAK